MLQEQHASDEVLRRKAKAQTGAVKRAVTLHIGGGTALCRRGVIFRSAPSTTPTVPCVLQRTPDAKVSCVVLNCQPDWETTVGRMYDLKSNVYLMQKALGRTYLQLRRACPTHGQAPGVMKSALLLQVPVPVASQPDLDAVLRRIAVIAGAHMHSQQLRVGAPLQVYYAACAQ